MCVYRPKNYEKGYFSVVSKKMGVFDLARFAISYSYALYNDINIIKTANYCPSRLLLRIR